jgi:YhcG PDDEXK nuclease domain
LLKPLVFYHRGLRALVLIELKLHKLTPDDVGQMNFYLNSAREHWTRPEFVQQAVAQLAAQATPMRKPAYI